MACDDVKLFAMYLPQFHEIPENNRFWGKGYTEWVAVKKARPLYAGHVQPRVPLGGRYYDLSQKEAVAWQAEIARAHGVSGWGMYHYWFQTGQVLLTKPAEILLASPEIDMPFFFAWDNGNWQRSWTAVKQPGNDWAPLMEQKGHQGSGILMQFVLGTEADWRAHFEYCLPYFRDARYVKKDGCPLFVVWNYSPEMQQMADYWDALAKEYGFGGMHFVYRAIKSYRHRERLVPASEYAFYYEPPTSSWDRFAPRLVQKVRNCLHCGKGMHVYDYDKAWKQLLRHAESHAEAHRYHGAFVTYDDTPRRGAINGRLFRGASPEKFGRYLSKLLSISAAQRKEYVFLTAWNEWGEGAYLEPDEENGYAYLEALRDAVASTRGGADVLLIFAALPPEEQAVAA